MYVKDGICCNRRADLEQANKQIKQAWSDYMEPFGTVQMVSEDTRVTASSRTLIDHIYTNCTENNGLRNIFLYSLLAKCMCNPRKESISQYLTEVLKILMRLSLLFTFFQHHGTN